MPYKTRPKLKPLEKVARHLREFWAADGPPELLNAGELADALLGERNGLSLVRFLNDLLPQPEPHKVLLVTKSNWIENLVEVGRPDLFIVSFSVNAPRVAERWEKGAPSPLARLDAAAELSKLGYEVRLRVDPMVPVENWESQYKSLFSAIFSRFRPARITLGSLRGLQSTINNARDKSWTVFLSETSRWGKRVPEAARVEMFGLAVEMLNREFAFAEIALCKEPVAVWEALGLDWHNVRCNCTW